MDSEFLDLLPHWIEVTASQTVLPPQALKLFLVEVAKMKFIYFCTLVFNAAMGLVLPTSTPCNRSITHRQPVSLSLSNAPNIATNAFSCMEKSAFFTFIFTSLQRK